MVALVNKLRAILHRGFGSHIISPISGAVIDFLGEIYVDDTDLIATHPDLETPEAVLDSLHLSAETWSSGLNSTGGAINPDKSRWILASYEWINGLWRYSSQPEIEMTIPLLDGTRAPISNGQVTTTEKSVGVWSAINGVDSKHIEENVTGKTASWASPSSHGVDSIQVQTMGGHLVWYCHSGHPSGGVTSDSPNRKLPVSILSGDKSEGKERVANLAPSLWRYWPVQLLR